MGNKEDESDKWKKPVDLEKNQGYWWLMIMQST